MNGDTAGGESTASRFIGRYQILERIAEGGMGSLYLARDPVIERLLAIKVLRRGYDSQELRERFAREGRAAGRLRHPNIVTIFDVGEHDGAPFIAMEFLAGETLAGLIQQGARLALPRRLKLIEELCDGLAYAHRAGIVHRDIKPANLMVIAEGTLKILDFGIVRLGDAGTTVAGRIVGTVNYMSPEQVIGEGVDHRSDIFAVGLVAYELLSYRQAFPGKLSEAIFNRILNVTIEPLEQLSQELDPEVLAIVYQALKRDPAARYQAIAQMRNDLSRVRQRLEQEHEQRAASALADAGETIVFSSSSPGVAPPPTPARPGTLPGTNPGTRPGSAPATAGGTSLEDAKRALTDGDYRSAMLIAARTAAVNPADVEASAIFDQAHSSLLDHARRQGEEQKPPTTSRTAPPVETRSPWPLIASAVALLLVIVAVLVWRMQRPAPEPAPPIAAAQPTQTLPVQPEPRVSTPSEPVRPPDATPSAPVTTQPLPAPTPAQRPPERLPDQRPLPAPPPKSTESVTPPRESPSVTVQPRRAGVDVDVPRRIRNVEPVYPVAALASRTRGTVQIELTISREGQVADARITRSNPPFDQAALQAVRLWEYAPTTVNGEAVPVIHSVSVNFAPPEAEPAPRETQPAPPAKPEVPPPAPPPAPPAPAPVDPNAEATAIRGALKRYEDAWRALDVGALRRVHALSNSEAAQIERAMNAAQSYDVVVDVQDVTVSGARAQVVARVARRFRPRVGRATDVTELDAIDLEKRGDSWMIVRFTRR